VPRALHISVEGSIASGKSTLVQEFAKYCEKRNVFFKPYEEPLSEWTSFGTGKTNFLGLMYKNPAKYSCDFQVVALLSKLEQLYEFSANKNFNILTEQTIEAQQRVFVPMLQMNGGLQPYQFEMLDRLMGYEIVRSGLTPDLYIYMRTPPYISRERIRQRNRREESHISISYLVKLNELYEKWFTPLPPNVIIVDTTQPIKMDEIFESIWEWAIITKKFDALVYPWTFDEN
jgi:deoxyadenosine/deoxycytidine kinase